MLFSLVSGALRENVVKADETYQWVPINNGLTNTIVSSIAIDPTNTQVIYAGTWGGGIFKSTSGGTNWVATNNGFANTYGNFIKCLVIDPKNTSSIYSIVLPGFVYVSNDSGSHWSELWSDSDAFDTAIAIDPQNTSIVYSGTTYGLIFKFTVNGAQFQTLGWAEAGADSILSLSIDQNNESIIYAGTSNLGAFKSTDGGQSFSPINNGLTNISVHSLAIDPKNTQVIYAGTDNGVFKSTDGGSNWKSAGLTNISVHSLAIDPKNTQVIYAGTDNGVFKSTDGGSNWIQINKGLTNIDVRSIAIDPSNTQIIYAGTNGGGVFKLIQSGTPTFTLDIWVDKGCGSTYQLGDYIRIYGRSSVTVDATYIVQRPDGTFPHTMHLNANTDTVLAEGSLSGPIGQRTYTLRATYGGETKEKSCSINMLSVSYLCGPNEVALKGTISSIGPSSAGYGTGLTLNNIAYLCFGSGIDLQAIAKYGMEICVNYPGYCPSNPSYVPAVGDEIEAYGRMAFYYTGLGSVYVFCVLYVSACENQNYYLKKATSSSGLSADIWVDRGCGSTYKVGESGRVYFKTNMDAYVEIYWSTNGSTPELFDKGNVTSNNTYYDDFTIAAPVGTEVVTIKATAGGLTATKSCTFYSVEEKKNPPTPPQNLKGTFSESSITLTWTTSTKGTYNIAGYAVYRGTSPGGESSTPIATVNVNTTTYEDKNITLGTTYYYYVKAYDTYTPPNYSDASNEANVSAVTRPSTPQNFTATVYSDKIVLNWNASTQGTYPIAGYAIWRATSPDFDFINSEPFARVPANTTSFTDLNISAGKYYYQLRAYDNQTTPNYSGFTYKLPVFTYEAFKSVSEFSITPDDGFKESTFSSDRVKVTFLLKEISPVRKVNVDLLYVLNSSSNQVAIGSFQVDISNSYKLQTVWEYPKILGNKEAEKPFELENFKLIVKIKSYSIPASDNPVVFYDNLDIESHKYSLYSVAQPASNPSLNPPGFVRNRDGYEFVNDTNFYFELIDTKLQSEVNSLNLLRWQTNLLLDSLEFYLLKNGACRGLSASAILYREKPYVKPNKQNTFDMSTSDARVIDNIVNYHFNQFLEEFPTAIRLELLKKRHLVESSNINSDSLKSLEAFIRSNREALIVLWNLGRRTEDGGHAVAAYQLIKDEDNGVSCVGIYNPNYSNDSVSTPYFKIDSKNVLKDAPFDYDTFLAIYPRVDFPHLTLQKAADLLNPFLSLFKDIDIIFPHSPINILIADSSGRKLGYVNGKIINEIPGASYSQLSDTDVVYYMPSGISYSVTTTGTESGTFGLDILTGVENNGMKKFVTYENVPTVKNAHSEVTVSPTSSYTLNVDTDGNGTFDTQKTPSINTAIAIPPDSPLTLTANTSNNSVTLNWSPSAQGTYPIAGYAIYRETKSDEESTTLIATVGASTTFYTDTGITSGVTYYYYVKAFDNQNPPDYSSPSPEITATIADKTPPVISIPSPADYSTVSSSEVKLSGKVIDDQSGIDKVTVNGNLVSLSSDGSFNTTINLSEGLNKIMILAIDKAGNQTTKILSVIYEKPPQIITIQLQISNPLMTVNGVSKEIDPGRGTTPVIIKEWGRTVVPIRAIVEALGGTIDWDGSTRKVTINFKNTTIELWIDNPKAKADGKETWIDSDNHNVKPVIQNGRTMLPLRFVAESLGAKVDWDTETKTITITYPEP